MVSSDENGRLVWNAIPGRQYNGRHAESGGLARGEQEPAIKKIRGTPPSAILSGERDTATEADTHRSAIGRCSCSPTQLLIVPVSSAMGAMATRLRN
ncbi:MAG: hypothetical protein J07HN4v3_01591 [Halonotius sp. J07HN4]|nr:MAG: hypothetical protein J07HN4v3_01591 [Halonotius sp. J07HN4]